jgi:flagellar basal body-associated protein FliL
MKKIISIFILCLMVILPLAYAGVTNPLPSNIELLKGDSERFKFQIQALHSESDLICTYEFENENMAFSVVFDEDETLVPSGELKYVYGTVNLPKNIDFGTYSENFCVNCVPVTKTSGTGVVIKTCGLPIKVNVVEERTRDNLYVPEKETNFKVIIGIIVIVLILLAIVLYAYVHPICKKNKTIVKKKPVTKKKVISKKTTKKKVTRK